MRFFDTLNVEKPVDNVENHKIIHTVNAPECVQTSHWDFAQKKKTRRISLGALSNFTAWTIVIDLASEAGTRKNEILKKHGYKLSAIDGVCRKI